MFIYIFIIRYKLDRNQNYTRNIYEIKLNVLLNGHKGTKKNYNQFLMNLDIKIKKKPLNFL